MKKHQNHLVHESSPYLLQHAHNPVDWYAWKPEAFEKAKTEDKPILVSIGYSTCHWCHVMERESFEDEEVAAFMNEHFINIKVDREERPDVDQIYMEACQALTGSGGWPLNCFILPDGRPFYAGTYFPPRPAHNRPSWIQMLNHIRNIHRDKRVEVEEQANRMLSYIQRADHQMLDKTIEGPEVDSVFTSAFLADVFDKLRDRFDTEEGGFGGAPKFPGSMGLRFLLRYHQQTTEQEALDHVVFSLDKMIQGGIYDQLGGGFARYATDAAWLIPHFEKMVYDNALLVSLLADAYRLTGKKLYADTIRETLAFMEREMYSEEGGFFTALDADSEGVEGKFYVWTLEEVDLVLGDQAALFAECYGMSEEGNWEEVNILWRPKSLDKVAKEKGMALSVLEEKMRIARQQLFEVRAKRIRPGLDDKILLGWNGLMCSAFAEAHMALGDICFKEVAIKNMDFLLTRFAKGEQGGFYHSYREGQLQYDAFLEDYAFLIAALLDVYGISFDLSYLNRARDLADYCLKHFWDEENTLFFFTNEQQKDIILRRKEIYDSAQPSGNSTMADNLLRLAIIYDRADYRDTVTKMLNRIRSVARRYPSSFARWNQVISNIVYGLQEIVVIGPEANKQAEAINRLYLPGGLIMAFTKELADFPLVKDKLLTKDTYIYLCENYACRLPVKTIEEFVQLIEGGNG